MAFNNFKNKKTKADKELKALKEKVSRFSKTANQRLRELEKQGLEKGSFAYAKVEQEFYDKRDYMTTGTHTDRKTGRTKSVIKFRTALSGMTKEELEKELKALTKFLNARTSSRTGLRSVMGSQYQEYVKLTGTQPTFKEFTDVYSSASVQNLLNIFGSDTIVRLNKKFGNKVLDPSKLKTIMKNLSWKDEQGNIHLGITENQMKKSDHLATLNQYRMVEQAVKDYFDIKKE